MGGLCFEHIPPAGLSPPAIARKLPSVVSLNIFIWVSAASRRESRGRGQRATDAVRVPSQSARNDSLSNRFHCEI